MNNHIIIKIITRTPYQIIKTFRNLKINIYNITYNKNNIILEIDKKNYSKIKPYKSTPYLSQYFLSNFTLHGNSNQTTYQFAKNIQTQYEKLNGQKQS